MNEMNDKDNKEAYEILKRAAENVEKSEKEKWQDFFSDSFKKLFPKEGDL